MSIHDRALPTVTVDDAMAERVAARIRAGSVREVIARAATVPRCSTCGQVSRGDVVTAHTVDTVWKWLDGDLCPACGSWLARRGKLMLAWKNRIARKLLGPPFRGNWGFAGLGESRRSEERKVRR